MLQSMRAGKGSVILKLTFFGLLLMAMVGLAVMDVQGMFRSGVKQDYIAKIDGQKFSSREFDRIVQQELQQKNIRSDEAYRVGLPQQILIREINSRIFARAAHDLGLLVDDATVANEIKRILKPLTEKGTPEKAALAHLLRTYGMSEGQLIGAIKSEIATNALLQTVAGGGSKAPEQMVKDAMKYRYESRRGEYFTLTAADAGDVPAPSDADLQAAYKAMAADFMQPETRDFAVVVIDPKSLGAEVNAAGTDKKAAQQAAAELVYNKANQIDDMIANGTPLADIAKEYGLKETVFEKVTADQKIETKIPVFNKVMQNAFGLDKGQVSQLIETANGEFVVVETRDIVLAAPTSFEKVKAEVAKGWKAQKQAEALDKKASAITERLSMGEGFDKVAESLGKKIQRTDMLQRGNIADAKSTLPRGMVNALFSIEKIGQSIAVPGADSLSVMRLAERQIDAPAKPKEEDANAIRNLLGRSLQNDLVEQYRQSLLAKYNVKINDELLNAMYAPKSEENQ